MRLAAEKVWRESPVRTQHEVLDTLRTGLGSATYQLQHTRSTNPDVLAVYRGKVAAYDAAINILEELSR